MDDEGLADVSAANPFRYPDFTQESLSQCPYGAIAAIEIRRSARMPRSAPMLKVAHDLDAVGVVAMNKVHSLSHDVRFIESIYRRI